MNDYDVVIGGSSGDSKRPELTNSQLAMTIRPFVATAVVKSQHHRLCADAVCSRSKSRG